MTIISSRDLLRKIGYDEERLKSMTDEDCETEVKNIYNQ